MRRPQIDQIIVPPLLESYKASHSFLNDSVFREPHEARIKSQLRHQSKGLEVGGDRLRLNQVEIKPRSLTKIKVQKQYRVAQRERYSNLSNYE